MKNLMKITQRLRPIILPLLFVAFIVITYNTVSTTENIILRVFIVVVALLVLIITSFVEYAKVKYTQLQKELIMSDSLQTIRNKRHAITKIDRVNALKDSLVIFDVLFALDENQPQKAIELIESNEALFKSKLDMVLIKYHSLFKAYTLLDNRTQAKKSYQQLAKLKSTNLKKPNKMSLLYNWDQIEALNTFYNQKDASKALKAYQNVATNNMNPRELLHYYVELREVAKSTHRQDLISLSNQEINQISSDSPFREENV